MGPKRRRVRAHRLFWGQRRSPSGVQPKRVSAGHGVEEAPNAAPKMIDIRQLQGGAPGRSGAPASLPLAPPAVGLAAGSVERRVGAVHGGCGAIDDAGVLCGVWHINLRAEVGQGWAGGRGGVG
jgi:hypothetical protein